jgi:predicted 2-oxoglutarate/Fe(II)-dependent dioxygenase YbiX/peroxiredoxin
MAKQDKKKEGDAPSVKGKPMRYARLTAGDPAPWFVGRETLNPQYRFDTAGGRYILLCFFGSSRSPMAKSLFDDVLNKHRNLFDDSKISFFGVSADPGDIGKLKENIPGIRFFHDEGFAISKLYGSSPMDGTTGDGSGINVRCVAYVLDPTMRIMKTVSLTSDSSHVDELVGFLKALPPVNRYSGIELQAPVIYLPNVFEPEFCRELIDLYEKEGGQESGFMRDVQGKTVEVRDYARKSRRDTIITEDRLLNELSSRIHRRIVPEIRKVHQFHVSRIERYIVACYSAEEQGHFAAHRDDTTLGTAHRRFAVTINLNSEFEGGELSFPEYGERSFKPAPGGAVVFSCSLLHAVSKVTKGKRYAFLPFLYDEAARKVREENFKFLASNSGE